MVVKFLTKLSLDALKKNLRFTKYLDFSVSNQKIITLIIIKCRRLYVNTI